MCIFKRVAWVASLGLCPWPAGGENPGQVGEVGGKGSCTSTPLPRSGRCAICPLCPVVDTEAQPHLLKAAEPRCEPRAAVPDSLGQKWPQARLLPHPLIPSHPPVRTAPPPLFQPWTAFLRVEDVDGGVGGYTYSVPRCLARRRCYISICSCYYFSLGGSWHLALESKAQREHGQRLPGASVQ